MNYSASEINEISEGLILEYFKSYKKPPERVDIEDFITQYLNISIVVETFAEKDNDRMGYTSNGKTSLSVIRDNVFRIHFFYMLLLPTTLDAKRLARATKREKSCVLPHDLSLPIIVMIQSSILPQA